MTGLTELALHDTQLDDEGLGQLAPLRKLTSLKLQRTVNLTDDGLKYLKNFPELTHLALLDDNITDRGIGRIKGYPICGFWISAVAWT